jgi:S1-C subfamily serine protease
LDDVRADILTGITWLEQSGFRRLANDLESRIRAAESSPSQSIASNKIPSQQITGFGTCFAVSSTEVLTSHHVVADASLLTVRFQDGREIGAVISQQSRATDLALLKVNGKTPASLPLAAPRSLAVGEPVFTLGFPATSILGEDAKFTEGSVSALSGIQGDASYFQMSVPVQPGNSGGPVVNMRGEVAGIVAATAAIEAFYATTGALPQNVNWASKSEHARLLFDPPTNDKRAKDRDEAIQMARSAVCKVTAIQNR